jgi:FAD/FMN-containing dehydrogenase
MSLDAIRVKLGASVFRAHGALELEGAKLEATLSPTSGEELAMALAACSEQGLPVLVRGGGSKLSLANSPCRARVLLETRSLVAEPEIDTEDGVALLSAGATLASVRAALDATGWELPLESADDEATVGGTIATAAESPRFGAVRDYVLGLNVALASGERVKFGGRVVKNVTGYDLNKLFTGSCGTLGVIEAAWVRLKPRPETVRTLHRDARGFDATEILEACRRSSVRVGLVTLDGAARSIHLELAGDEAAVRSDATALSGNGFAEAETGSAPDMGTDASALNVRIRARATAWQEAAEVLALGGGRVVASPAGGSIWSALPLAPTSGGVDEGVIGLAWQLARTAAERGEGTLVVEGGPVFARAGREVFGDPGETIPLQRAIKAQYDAAGILNPGRYVGGA